MKRSITPSKRKYNQWVANETLEDFALRFTPQKARKWSGGRIANTALGVVSFLALEAIGGAITLQYGFINSFWAILVVSFLIFLFGLPICYHAAKSGLDIDLLTRAAGFGYIGSTVSSLIYASFTFIFFALEAAIMSVALQLAFDIPISWAYVISALIVIPLVTHGISRISTFQLWTQPIWLLLQLTPLFFILTQHGEAVTQWIEFSGLNNLQPDQFNLLLFGAASAVIFPLMAQNGEQVDFLRFLPLETKSRKKWWLALIISGPGWTIFGVIKMLIGSFLAVLALQHGVINGLAADPTHMYLIAYSYVTHSTEIALVLVAVFVVISQLKINITNAYAGSLAWSNFFSRLTHSHPGRVVWLFFNVAIALLLMELGLYQAFENILITYSSLVLAWIGTLVADLVINRALKLRPSQINFQRGHLYDINPVGLGSMLMASTIGILGQFGLLGDTAQALSPYLALFSPFIFAPFIAWWSKGQYYLVKEQNHVDNLEKTCIICENKYEAEDMNHCPAYDSHICSLCCSLDTQCADQCRPKAHLNAQILQFLNQFLPSTLVHKIHSSVGHFLTIFVITALLIAGLFTLVFVSADYQSVQINSIISDTLFNVFFLLMIITGVLIWLYVLARASKQKAFEESQQRTEQLSIEINAHDKTFNQLQQAKESAISANHAKSRYLSGVSHELRTPLNTILGYAQLLELNSSIEPKDKRALTAIRRGGEHLTDVIEGLLEISKIEARKLDFHKESINLKNLLDQLVEMFEAQANAKGLTFHYTCKTQIPTYIVTDEKRLRQILMNLLSNAIKYTPNGEVNFTISYRNQVAKFDIQDTGVGIASEQHDLIFEPFERFLSPKTQQVSGTGLGLTISRLLSNVMGGDIALESTPNKGSRFTLSIMLPISDAPLNKQPQNKHITGYVGIEKTILVVDDEEAHRQLMIDFLTPLNFKIIDTDSGIEAQEILAHHTVDLILLDIQMPLMNGWQLAKKLRNNHINTPIIMVSGNAIESNTSEMNSILHQAYIIKPIRLSDLLDKIGLILDIKWQIEEDGNIQSLTEKSSDMPELLPSSSELNELINMAKIGYLNGVLEKIDAFEKNNIDKLIIKHLRAKADLCDFESIIETAKGLIHEL